jgi:hypothetical protein
MSSARSFIVSGWFCPASQVWVEVILHMDGQMLWHFLSKTALLYWTASALWLKTNGPHDRVSFSTLLPHWSRCLSFHQHHTVLITVGF